MTLLTPYRNPLSAINQLQNEMNQLLDRFFGETDTEDSRVMTSHWVPPVDIIEEPERFVLLADLPGVESNDMEITMEGGMLTIRGERRANSEQRGDYRRAERVHGTFYRRFGLPDTADPERISAKCRNGVLEVVIPKQEAKRARRIPVNA